MYKVLVIVDMQNDFLTGSLGNKECAGVVSNVVDVIKNGKWDFYITTQDTHHEENYANTQEGKKLPVLHTVYNTYGWKLEKTIEEVLKEKPVLNITKPSFGSIGLGQRLKDLYDTHKKHEIPVEVTFVGVCTGICVISNVLLAKAFVPEVTIRVVEDACACVTPDSHKTAIDAMKTCQVDIIKVEDINREGL